MMPYRRHRRSLVTAAAAALAIAASTVAWPSRGQVVDSVGGGGAVPGLGQPEVHHNRNLRIKADRTNVRAFEPIYLVLTADAFLPDVTVEVLIDRNDGKFTPVQIDPKAWVKSQAAGMGDKPVERQGVVLQLAAPRSATGGKGAYLFPDAGTYRVRVRVGPDSTTLTFNVASAQPGEQQAWDLLGDKVAEVLDNDFDARPEQATVDACGQVIRQFPKSVCAGYCQSYLSIARFKLVYDKTGRQGGKAAYGAAAEELAKVHAAFKDTFFGEMTGFYAAYTLGLTHDFDRLLPLAEGVTTHYTPWSDTLLAMRLEVLAHRGPRVIPVDPGSPVPGSGGPATVPSSSAKP